MRGLLKTAYDKLALFLVLLILLVSAILLVVFVCRENKLLVSADWNQPNSAPRNVQPIDTGDLSTALESLVDPFQMPYGARRMLVSEPRVACVKCQRPIPLTAQVCPFRGCGASQPLLPKAEERDTDLDGIPDAWELKYGLNPNLDDAQGDADGDGYSNLEEYLHGTNPQDPHDHPPPVIKLHWVRIARQILPLTFQSIQHPAPGEVRYVLKNKRIQRDYYVQIGDVVEGYEIVACEEKKEEIKKPGLPAIIEDVSVLQIRKDGQTLALTLGQDASQGDMVAELVFLIDNTVFRVKVGDTITLQHISYKIVDIQKNSVVVFDNSTGKKTSLEKAAP